VPYDQFGVVSVKDEEQTESFLIIFVDSNLPKDGLMKSSPPLTETDLRAALKELEQSKDQIEFCIRLAREARTYGHQS